MYCPQCGFENKDGVNFCAKCGYNYVTGQRGNVQPIKKNNKSTGKKVAMGCGISVLVVFLLFVGLFVLVMMLPESEPTDDINGTISTTESTTEKQTETTTENPIIYVTVEEMVAEFEANQVAAEKKYKGQTIAVTGIVDNVGIDILDDTYISLVASECDFYGVQCYVKNSEIDLTATLQPGDKITVIGEYDDYMLNVIMEKCEIKRD